MNKEICILNGTKWILGDESTEPMNWEDANNWCKSIGQDLPPREVLLMAFLNPEIRSKFANTYYWSSSEFDSYSAWDQDFNIGDQNVNFSKSAKLSVRAVRAIIAEASEQTEQEPFDWETKKKSYLDEIDRLGMEANKDQEEIDRLTDLLFSKPATYIGKTQWMQVPEPLSEKDICQILIKKEWKGFVDLVRAIEKAHGIGGGE